MFTGVIFDVEGTLVEGVPQNLRSLGEALKSFGYEIPKETLQLYSWRPDAAARRAGRQMNLNDRPS